jgi:HD-like signal output (HDOD) protein/CheY-like chemotaxis protein
MLHPLRNEWKMAYASNGREALQLLSLSQFDVLVTDVRMPEVNGIELLTAVIREYPQMVRIVLSGTADHELTLRSVTLAHQYLMKPCDSATLLSTLENALTLRNILDDPSLTALIGRIRSLPSLPTIYHKLMNAVQSAETPVAVIGDIIAEDLAMSAKVLQWVNSPLFGSRRTIANPKEAAIYLGVETVKAMALTESVFSRFDSSNTPGFSVEELRDHSFQVATMARQIARSQQLPRSVVDDVFLAGLMHDLGKLVLGCNFPRQYQEVVKCSNHQEAALEAERKIFGTTHAEVGGYILWLWGLPKTVTAIVVRHHTAGPETAEVRDPAGIVNWADWLARQPSGNNLNSDLKTPPSEAA